MGINHNSCEEDARVLDDQGSIASRNSLSRVGGCFPEVASYQAEDDGKDKDKADAGPYAAHGADNQKLNLLAAMLKVDDWASAELLLEALEPVLPVAYAPVAQALCEHMHRFIDKVYRQVQVGFEAF